MSEFAVVESVSRYETGRFAVRVWRQELWLQNGYPHSQSELDNLLDGVPRLDWEPTTIIEAIAGKMDRVNAVEVTDKNTHQSVVVYPEWP